MASTSNPFITREKVLSVVDLLKTNQKEADKRLNELSLRAPLYEGLLLRAHVAGIKAKAAKGMEQSFYGHYYAYSNSVAVLLAKAMREENMAEKRGIMSAINVYEEFEAPIPGELKLGIKYLTAAVLGKDDWKMEIADKLKKLVDTNIALRKAIEGQMGDWFPLN